MTIMKECIPKATISPQHNLPWMNRNINQKEKQCYQERKGNGMPILVEKYRSLRNEVVNVLRQSKRDHLKRMSSQGSKQFWKTVKFLKKTSIQIPTLKKGSDEISSNAGKASLLNEVLSQNFNLAIPPLTEADSQHFMVNPSTIPPQTILCTEEEVLGLLLAIDTSKASGPDGISGKMLKNTALSISPVMKLFNLPISTGKIPHQWKISSAVPIPKSSANMDNPCNYRPIALLPVISSYWKDTSIAYSF